jgi:hypothetical protein
VAAQGGGLTPLLFEKRLVDIDLQSLVQSYTDQWTASVHSFRTGIIHGQLLSPLADVRIRLDDNFCREVATYYECAPALNLRVGLLAAYDVLKRQTLQQYHAIVNGGIEIRPWQGSEQPYQNSWQLRHSVSRTRKLYVYLTSAGHGQARPGFHPLREPSGIQADGIEFCYNDLFRATHDVFGHIIFGNDFGPKGEFLAAFCQMHFYSQEAHRPLFTEQIGQICWFYYGPHLLDCAGRLPECGTPGYAPPSQRPYPEQKVFAFPQRFLDRFTDLFELGRSPDV